MAGIMRQIQTQNDALKSRGYDMSIVSYLLVAKTSVVMTDNRLLDPKVFLQSTLST